MRCLAHDAPAGCTERVSHCNRAATRIDPFGVNFQEVTSKTHGHYPGPLAAIDVIREGMALPLSKALEVEAEAFSELVVLDSSKNLMNLFFMKTDVESRAAKLGKGGLAVQRIGVLGAGKMVAPFAATNADGKSSASSLGSSGIAA